MRSSTDAREECLGLFASTGLTLIALNRNGNPLHPDPQVREKHAGDVRDASEGAARTVPGTAGA